MVYGTKMPVRFLLVSVYPTPTDAQEGKYVLERPKLVVSDGAATAAAYSMCPIEILSGTHDSDSEEVFV